ncbi:MULTISPECIES: CDP-alcohol phosphatidyltransferase family protein [Methylococcus]|jgi:cardiolipin synthase|uniref:CDP-diacylglycerol--glycerol-3-phosphate 3-phosphatidyltransferase n=2 Tax=Methylococcus capsulatus TaxID=414 RepID=Q60BU3_METCA|nr:CDP-alcohol phosphatidyltransferase family protein [Methylococcus capsulatus]AAU90508.1 CDP-alcohol phosphatidyltransferase family protein [Methylococcus capsulatus str. Bath]QXP88797.1 CDP-alcohol phosphatidyltransferase family protein [Methylococcus capsulatus]QXP94171.1 CDP-alcohol phosphatidyltransferase family protein [Methylococcus capsulatus]UQN11087.1 CDP-alcohol phosphatidyltransferase family protein [Methylococcus capsulatus]CAI8769844.1 CDP-alcohol phosphatidyltransferase family 
MRPEHIPNIISTLRIFLVYPVVHLMLAERYTAALALFVVAGVSDAIDGFLAKHYGWQSRLGSYLDPLADKLLLVCCFVAGAWLGLLPVWMAAAVLLRDAVIVTGAIAYYLLLHPFDGQPILASKLNTLLQLAFIVAILFNRGVSELPPFLLDGLLAATLATTIASGAIYVYVWGRNYRLETAQGRR